MLRYALSFKKLKLFGDDNKRKSNMAIEAVLRHFTEKIKTTVLIDRVTKKLTYEVD